MLQPREVDKRFLQDHTMSTERIAKIIAADEESVRSARHQFFKKGVWHGCDDDCDNCEYSDCLKPYSEF